MLRPSLNCSKALLGLSRTSYLAIIFTNSSFSVNFGRDAYPQALKSSIILVPFIWLLKSSSVLEFLTCNECNFYFNSSDSYEQNGANENKDLCLKLAQKLFGVRESENRFFLGKKLTRVYSKSLILSF